MELQFTTPATSQAPSPAPVATAQTSASCSLTMDMPLFIRLLEFSREDASNDVDLHVLAENAAKLMAGGAACLNMDNYAAIVPAPAAAPAPAEPTASPVQELPAVTTETLSFLKRLKELAGI